MSKTPKVVAAMERLARTLTGHRTPPIPLALAVLTEAVLREVMAPVAEPTSRKRIGRKSASS